MPQVSLNKEKWKEAQPLGHLPRVLPLIAYHIRPECVEAPRYTLFTAVRHERSHYLTMYTFGAMNLVFAHSSKTCASTAWLILGVSNA
jgi:hypothetical protein